jgi:nitrite reductase/ring-hydroxylating ferredoxin subunit
MDELVRVTTVDQLGEKKLAAFGVNGEWVAIAAVDGAYYAFEDICPHRQCSLAGGHLEGRTVICPCHGSEFDVATGKRLAGPAPRDIRTYPVRLENGVLTIER